MAKRAIAVRAICSDCCAKQCLLNFHNQNVVIDILIDIQHSLYGFSRDEKKNFLRDKIRDCIVPVSSKLEGGGKNNAYNWTVGAKDTRCIQGVCRGAFCNAYGIGHTYLENLCAEIKDGVRFSQQV